MGKQNLGSCRRMHSHCKVLYVFRLPFCKQFLVLQHYPLQSSSSLTPHHDVTKQRNPIQVWCSLELPTISQGQHRARLQPSGFLASTENHCSPCKQDLKSANLKRKKNKQTKNKKNLHVPAVLVRKRQRNHLSVGRKEMSRCKMASPGRLKRNKSHTNAFLEQGL
jgi:hypothetical protein